MVCFGLTSDTVGEARASFPQVDPTGRAESRPTAYGWRYAPAVACLKQVIVMGPTGQSFFSTLWLCQNSYWKWPFIVDLPIKNGDFP